MILEVAKRAHKFWNGHMVTYQVRRTRRALVLATAAALAVLFVLPRAYAAVCAASEEGAPRRDRDAVLLAANADAAAGRFGRARAGYLWILARRPDDAEALYGLARVDAWEGCSALAQSSYARALEAHPEDADLRAGFVDVLLWEGRYDEAERLLELGLARSPSSAPLLLRRARLAYWRGDAPAARALMDAAAASAPDDPDVAEARAKMFTSEARVSGRLDGYPAGYPDVYALGAQVMHRPSRVELYGGVQLVRRTETAASEGVTDARYPVGVLYHTGIGAALGLEVAPAAPARALPNVAVRASALTPITNHLGAFLSYSFWHFDGGTTVHILNPSLGIGLPRDVRLDLRGWISALRVPDARPGEQAKIAGAVGASIAVPASRALEIGGWYTYGVQLDRNPALLTILAIESHSTGAFADVRIDPRKGLRPLVAVEQRNLPSGGSLWGAAFELGAYVRW